MKKKKKKKKQVLYRTLTDLDIIPPSMRKAERALYEGIKKLPLDKKLDWIKYKLKQNEKENKTSN